MYSRLAAAALFTTLLSTATAYTCPFVPVDASYECGVKCQTAGFAKTSCTPACGYGAFATNLHCLCQDTAFNDAFAQCIYESCGGLWALQEVAPVYSAACARTGVSLPTQPFINEGQDGPSSSAPWETTAAVSAATTSPSGSIVVSGNDARRLKSGNGIVMLMAAAMGGTMFLL